MASNSDDKAVLPLHCFESKNHDVNIGNITYENLEIEDETLQTEIETVSQLTEDEKRLAQLGYTQEVKRIFGTFTNFGLTASMISILLGIVPLYVFCIQTGGNHHISRHIH